MERIHRLDGRHRRVRRRHLPHQHRALVLRRPLPLVYDRWRPKQQSQALLDAADAVDLLAHESQHLFNARGDEAETECHGLQDVRRLAVLLGASKAYAERLARDDWRFLYPARPPDYRTPECGPNRLFDMQPETPDFP